MDVLNTYGGSVDGIAVFFAIVLGLLAILLFVIAFIAIEIPPGHEMQIRDRSGIASKTKLRVANAPGTIDADFRAEVKVIIDNIAHFTRKDYIAETLDGGVDTSRTYDTRQPAYKVRKGDRIAQGVIAPVEHVTFAVVDELSETARGAGGFGSSGTHTGVTAEEAAENMRRAASTLPTLGAVITE